jgi:hypothetical protein
LTLALLSAPAAARAACEAVLKMAQVGFMAAAPLALGAATPDDVWRFRVMFNLTRRVPPAR